MIWRASGTLGRNLIAQILLANALLSLIASSIQLYAGYHRDESRVLESISIIDASFREGFEDALWDYNFRLAEALLSGVYNKADVEYVLLTTSEGRRWELGARRSLEMDVHRLEFTHPRDDGVLVTVGELSVGLTLAHVKERLWSQLCTLLMSNFAKTVIASVIMLLLFEHRVGRHLRYIAVGIAKNSRAKDATFIRLNRSEPSEPDDLDHIVTAINLAKYKSQSDFILLSREIEQRQIVEAMLKQRTAALEAANREQAEFTYAISHDLKAPANTIAMLLGELEEVEGDRLTDDGKEILEDANHTVSRMTHLVEDVLGYARTVESGMEPETIDLTALAREIRTDLRGDINLAQAEVTIEALPVVSGSRVQLHLLLQNLMSNAIKFRSPDRPSRVMVLGLGENDIGQIGFSVVDNGIGIPAEFQDKVFGLFQRLHAHGVYDGSGLGLSLCKRIVHNHGGDIRLSSDPGKGSQFDIWLPGREHG